MSTPTGRCLAIDPGTQSGWAVLDGAGVPIAFGTWRMTPATDYGRWEGWIDFIQERINEWQPDYLACEYLPGLGGRRGVRSIYIHGALNFMMEMLAARNMLPLTKVNPGQWKKMLGVKNRRKASDPQPYVKKVNEMYRLAICEKKQEDAAAAIGVGFWAVHSAEEF